MENQGTMIQLSLWESIAGLLCLSPVFIAGLAVTCIILYMILRRKRGGADLRTMIFSALLYYYLCIVFCNIVGTPSLSQLLRTASYGEPLFAPNINLVPFVDGISMGYILNVICFIPLGFLAPLISTTYEKAGKCFLLGFGVSLGIEISQMFTPYRATDIDDLVANVLGVMAGWLILRLLMKSRMIRRLAGKEQDCNGCWYLPVITTGIVFLAAFIS